MSCGAAPGGRVVPPATAVPAVVDAIAAQAARVTHTCFMVGPYEGYVEVCEQLAAHTPGSHAKLSALFNSGRRRWRMP